MKCLLCYQSLNIDEVDYHEKCVKRVFGTSKVPEISVDETQLAEYARKIVGNRSVVTGVQPKLSLWLEQNSKNVKFTIVDSHSNFILKPQSIAYKALPENEDLCMHLAACFGIETAIHGLIRLQSGNLAYVTKRFDRVDDTKLAMEDLCQLTGTLTQDKYGPSYAKAGKAVRKYSTREGLDVLSYFQLVVFSFITGNSDMHLKNFSLLEGESDSFVLSPAYDLVSTVLVIPDDKEEMALTINNKKANLSKKDFDQLGELLMIPKKSVEVFYLSLREKKQNALWWIENSFLPEDHKQKFTELLSKRIAMFSPPPSP